MSTNDVSVVLAHGAWADGSSWAKVIGPLAAAGSIRAQRYAQRTGIPHGGSATDFARMYHCPGGSPALA